MSDRKLVVNRSGATVAVDIGRDMDEATFDAMVERGDFAPAPEQKPKASKSSAKK